MALETPSYELLEKEAKFEIRKYEAYITATVSLKGLDFEQANNTGFRLLADYIFGNNTKRDKLAMTAPVTQTPVSQSEKIAMTAPVKLNQTTDMHYEVSFVMPQKYTLETLPKPNNDAVSFRLIPPREVAVILFSGKVSEEKVAKMTDSLKAWMDKKKLKANSQASLAQYSPPFIPAFLRKNEISFEIKDSPDR